MGKDYNENNVCPKCENSCVRTEYNEIQDVLRRTCNRCGYTWFELPVDRMDTEYKENN